MEIKKTGLWFGRQAVRMCLMVLLVSILAFVLLAVSPIDPLQTNVGQTALGSMSPEQIARLKSYWGIRTRQTSLDLKYSPSATKKACRLSVQQ